MDVRSIRLIGESEEDLLPTLRYVIPDNPDDRTVAVYQPNLPPEEFEEVDTLGGFDALPGFACRVADLFR